jgi:hypothetical protein
LTGDDGRPTAAITHHHLPPDLEIVGGEPDWLTRTQADFSFGDRDNAALSGQAERNFVLVCGSVDCSLLETGFAIARMQTRQTVSCMFAINMAAQSEHLREPLSPP